MIAVTLRERLGLAVVASIRHAAGICARARSAAHPSGNGAIRITGWSGTSIIEVRDAETGFRDAKRTFEPFFTTKQHGMGMGLVICRSIIESHGGRLCAANNETLGATVAFTLPLAASEAP